MKALIARKVGMTSTISENGVVSPVTLLSVQDNTVTQIKSVNVDGYSAIQIGTETNKKPNKPQVNQFKTSKISPKVYATPEDPSNETPPHCILILDFNCCTK